ACCWGEREVRLVGELGGAAHRGWGCGGAQRGDGICQRPVRAGERGGAGGSAGAAAGGCGGGARGFDWSAGHSVGLGASHAAGGLGRDGACAGGCDAAAGGLGAGGEGGGAGCGRVCGDEQLSYGELEVRANQLAHHLRALGVGAERVVGVCLERSLELVVALIAILKAGGGYLPLDPGYPRERLSFMLADAGAAVLI